MKTLNRKQKYEILKEIIEKIDPTVLKDFIIKNGFYEYVKSHGFNEDLNTDDMESRRKEIIDFLDELYELWTKNYQDMTDRQFIIIEPALDRRKSHR